VDFLLIREKQLSERELYLATRRVLKATEDSRMLIFVAGRPQVALAANADGVHVGSEYPMVREAKRAFLESWVSVSCHSLADVESARAAGADVCLFGPVFGKSVDGVEVVPGAGLEALRQACAAAGKDLPVFALGGVTEANSAACVDAGASGVAGIRMFFAAE
jgi:thiamine-phosphate pyrophosphorylase